LAATDIEVVIVELLISFDDDSPGRARPDFEGGKRCTAKPITGR